MYAWYILGILLFIKFDLTFFFFKHFIISIFPGNCVAFKNHYFSWLQTVKSGVNTRLYLTISYGWLLKLLPMI